MSVLDIREYAQPQVAMTPQAAYVNNQVTKQQLAIGGSSTPSAAFSARTSLLRVHTDANCRLEWGTAPVADATSDRMSAGSTEYFWVLPGSSFKVAVISSS